MGIYFVVMGLGIAAFGIYMNYKEAAASKSPYVRSTVTVNNFEIARPYIYLVGGFALLFFVAAFICHRKMVKALDEEQEAYDKIGGLAGGHLSAGDFLSHRDTLRQSDFTGVYVLHNLTKDMYYVGQSIKVIDRVGQHLTGHGNGDVYADFKYGDEFEVSTLSLVGSGYASLNDLERETIAAYDAYDHGYNRTTGNAR